MTPKATCPWVRTPLNSAYDQPDADSVHAQFERVLEPLQPKLPKAAEHLEAACPDILAFAAFPNGLRHQVWSKEPQERQNREIRRRTDVASASPTATR